jgi:hypothetical protein
MAMWSGPRNISTAMMRSWGNRGDTVVCDEPLYAHYLKVTGIEHPGREEVIAHHESDWRKVAAWLTGPVPAGKAIFYQKHMSHHLLPEIERGWLDELTHGFLIRDPREMLTSLLEHLPNPRLEDTGLPQQLELVEYVRKRAGNMPPIIDARDVLQNPRRTLGLLCDAIGVDFQDAMLQWPPGRRDTDGIWAKHWYEAVERSTGFAPYKPKEVTVPAAFQSLLEKCMECYETLYACRLRLPWIGIER